MAHPPRRERSAGVVVYRHVRDDQGQPAVPRQPLHGTVEAALEACRLRLRPIVMTSIAFIAGVVPLLTAAAAAQRTQHLRLGIAVNLLPLHHPVRLAEEGAVLDVLTHGRMDFGVGRGGPSCLGLPRARRRPRLRRRA